MKNVLLLLLLVLLVLTVPSLRAFASPVIDPVGEKIVIVTQPLVDKVRRPFLEWKVRERVRDHGWEQWVASWLQDLRLAGRTLRATPLFTA